MFTLILLFAMKVAIPSEMACVGSIQDATLPLDVYVAAVEMEGTTTLAVQGQILYLNGPKASSLKAGTIYGVVRPEGKIRNSLTGDRAGYYYQDVGKVRIVSVGSGHATALVQDSCQGMRKGDLVVPDVPKAPVEFAGEFSTDTATLPPQGVASSILVGKDDSRQLAAGSICFIGLGSRDGVKAGDRFVVFRPYRGYKSSDMAVGKTASDATYRPIADWGYRFSLDSLLRGRKLPPQILGDIVVVETGSRTSTGKIVNSLSEIHVGDLVVKK